MAALSVTRRSCSEVRFVDVLKNCLSIFQIVELMTTELAVFLVLLFSPTCLA